MVKASELVQRLREGERAARAARIVGVLLWAIVVTVGASFVTWEARAAWEMSELASVGLGCAAWGLLMAPLPFIVGKPRGRLLDRVGSGLIVAVVMILFAASVVLIAPFDAVGEVLWTFGRRRRSRAKAPDADR